MSHSNRHRKSIGCAAIVLIGACVAMLLGHVIQQLREAAHGTQCRNNLKQWTLAFHNYHDIHRTFPLASTNETDGTRVRSWRVALTPLLDSSPFYNEYNHDESWDTAQNRRVAATYRSPVLWCPSQDHRNGVLTTDYVVVCGPGTAFPDDRTTSLADITDGPENTILLMEIDRSDIYWSEPRDLRIDQMSFRINDPSRPSISSAHPGGVTVGFADGAVYRLDPSIRPETLRALLTIAGGENVKRDDLIRGNKETSRVLGERTEGE
jgi:prepilin-type processing-associated H-X9-DG protein